MRPEIRLLGRFRSYPQLHRLAQPPKTCPTENIGATFVRGRRAAGPPSLLAAIVRLSKRALVNPPPSRPQGAGRGPKMKHRPLAVLQASSRPLRQESLYSSRFSADVGGAFEPLRAL